METIKNIWIITKKELRSLFDLPVAYIALAVFLLLWEFLFFRNALLVGESSLRGLFDYLPWLSLLLIPAITMGSVSQEKSEGTLEFLLTHPLKDIELLAGKFLGSLLFVAIGLLFIFPIAISFASFGSLDWGVVAGQYIGALFFAGVLVALGIFISSLFSSAISALLVTATSGFFLVIAGYQFVTDSVPLSLAGLFERLAVVPHVESMARGVVDLRDLWYFLSAMAIFLSLAFLQLLKRRFGNQRSLYRSYKMGVSLFIGIAILTNVVGGRIPGRIDLTQGRIYTLSEATRSALKQLPDVVNVNLYASSQLPAQLQPSLRDTKDMLRDYQRFSKGNLQVSYKDPSGNPEVAQAAASDGVREVQFNVIGQEEFQVKKGFLGLAINYAGKKEVIPYIQNTSDLEYQLTSYIKKLTSEDKKQVVFLSGHGEKNPETEYRYLNQELEKQFEVTSKALSTTTPLSATSTTLVIAGPTQKIDEQTKTAIKNFLDNGGSILLFIDGMAVNPQFMTAAPNAENFSDFLKEYGVEVKQDMVYDLRSNENVNFGGGGGGFGYVLPYPFWLRAGAASQSSPVTAKIGSMVLPWASSIQIDDAKLKEKGFTAAKLFATTKFAGSKADSVTLNPDQEFSQTGLGEKIMAASIESVNASANGKKARVIAVGSSNFLSDEFVQNSPENLAFGIQAISWLSQEESLAGIQLKQKAERRLQFENSTQVQMVKYGNMALAIILPLAYGSFRLIRRRNLRRLNYSNANI